MLLELDSDQRLWRDTARDVLGKECPASLVRSVAEDRTGSVDIVTEYGLSAYLSRKEASTA